MVRRDLYYYGLHKDAYHEKKHEHVDHVQVHFVAVLTNAKIERFRAND